MEVKSLQPLTHGSILIVGTMMSNFGPDIRDNPRVIMWPSDNQHWIGKSLPHNTRAVFITRFIGHVAFDRIITQARKKNITIFNPMGTGLIAKQVRELLNLNPVTEPTVVTEPPTLVLDSLTEVGKILLENKEAKIMPKANTVGERNKLKPLYPFIDFNKTDAENAHILFNEAKGMGINTTMKSLLVLSGKQRRKNQSVVVKEKPINRFTSDDVLITMFDSVIKEMQDMRAAYIATVKENNQLKDRMAQFKKLVE